MGGVGSGPKRNPDRHKLSVRNLYPFAIKRIQEAVEHNKDIPAKTLESAWRVIEQVDGKPKIRVDATLELPQFNADRYAEFIKEIRMREIKLLSGEIIDSTCIEGGEDVVLIEGSPEGSEQEVTTSVEG